MSISNARACDLPFVQLLMRVRAKQDFNSPQTHKRADDVIYQVNINLDKKNKGNGMAK